MFRILMILVALLFGVSFFSDGGDFLRSHTREYVTQTQEEEVTPIQVHTRTASPAITLQVRGIKNNNPGNIVRSNSRDWARRIPFTESTDQRFEQFETMEDGMAALIRLIYDYKFNWGDPSIADMSVRYCPEAPGSTSWARNVSGFSGIPVNQDYDWTEENIKNLLKGIITLECGHDAWGEVSWCFEGAFNKYRDADRSAVL